MVFIIYYKKTCTTSIKTLLFPIFTKLRYKDLPVTDNKRWKWEKKMIRTFLEETLSGWRRVISVRLQKSSAKRMESSATVPLWHMGTSFVARQPTESSNRRPVTWLLLTWLRRLCILEVMLWLRGQHGLCLRNLLTNSVTLCPSN